MESLINHIEKGIMVANPFGAGEKESKLLEIDNIYRNIYHQMELNNYGESFINSLGHRFYGLLDLSLNFLARDVKIIVIESKKTLLFNWKIFIIAVKIQIILYGLKGIIALCKDLLLLVSNPQWRKNIEGDNVTYLHYLLNSLHKILYLMSDYGEGHINYKKINLDSLNFHDKYYLDLLHIIALKMEYLNQEYKKKNINCGFMNALKTIESFLLTIIVREKAIEPLVQDKLMNIQENPSCNSLRESKNIESIIREITLFPNPTKREQNFITLMQKIYYNPALEEEIMKNIAA